jgi:hypothetical protein
VAAGDHATVLNVFRALRRGLLGEGSGQRYLRYAIGEIALVVIGILIALQINNWNEDRHDRKKEHEFLHSMLTDLREDLLTIDGAVRSNGFLLDRIADLLEILEEPLDRTEDQRRMFIYSAAYTYWYMRVEFSELTMSQLKSSGGLRLIGDPEVRRAMLKYEQGLASCKYMYTEIQNYFHAFEASQKKVLNMRLARQAFAYIESDSRNMFESIEIFEPLVPVGRYLIDDDPKLLTVYYTDLMFYRTALHQAVNLLKQQKLLAESLTDLIQDHYDID